MTDQIHEMVFFIPVEQQREVYKQLKHLIVDRLPENHIYKQALKNWAEHSTISRNDVRTGGELLRVSSLCNELDGFLRDGDLCAVRDERVVFIISDYRDMDDFLRSMVAFQTKITDMENKLSEQTKSKEEHLFQKDE